MLEVESGENYAGKGIYDVLDVLSTYVLTKDFSVGWDGGS